ncbi:MG2 domain-containing protein [Balneolaceae bacterium ANBcel3]|nr:MG2 domain-containing protein [Balneolaceae bacterium ANBcel3]
MRLSIVCRCLFLLVLLQSTILPGCSPTRDEAFTETEEVADFVRSHTRGDIYSDSEITIRLSRPIDEEVRESSSSLFSFRPSVRGTEHWADSRTIVFTPERPLENGQEYEARFALRSLFKDEHAPEVFRFPVRVIPQDMDIRFDPLEAFDATSGSYLLSGTVFTADRADISDVHHLLSARHDRERIEFEWEETGRNQYRFVSSEIARKEVGTQLEVSWNGRPIGVDARGNELFTIPSQSDFSLMDIQTAIGVNPRLILTFSEILDESQDMRGMIRIRGQRNPGVIIENNRIIVHPADTRPGDHQLTITGTLRSRNGESLDGAVVRTVRLGNQPPQVRLLGSGTILPASNELLLPFEAINLGAVDVSVTKIFENNIPHFLQHNNLPGSRFLQLLGRPVAEQVIPLHTIGEVQRGKWGSYALDLSNIIEPEPGAIYRVTIGYRQHQSLFPCDDDFAEKTEEAAARGWKQDEIEEEAYWEDFRAMRSQGQYNWRDRDNPCTPSYYHTGRRQHRNALASDFGLIAKGNTLGGLQVFVSDLTTAKPLEEIKLEVFDYQIQSLGSGKTDRNGHWDMPPQSQEPWLVLASRGDERGYLTLHQNRALSLSDFDVSGQQIQEGVKAFLYAERNVWRPGDSLFVNMIVEAEKEFLPMHHPATFELLDPQGRVVHRKVAHPFNRFYSFPTKTPEDAVTGRWQVRAHLGGNRFTKNVNIETIQPNRLRIELDFDEETVSGSTATVSGNIRAEWLHGAIASGLNTDVQLTMREGSLSFSEYPLFTFTNPVRDLDAQSREIFSGRLDDEGNTSFDHTVNRPNRSPGLIMLGLQTRVFEESGNFSTNRSQVRYIPFDRLAGFRISGRDRSSDVLQRDRNYTVETVLLESDGQPVSSGEVTVELYRLDWRWWWQRREENLSQFFARANRTPVLTQTLTTGADGKATMDFPMDDLRWGRYMIKVHDATSNTAHASGEVVFVGWGRDSSVQIGDPQRLIVETDEASYTTGENIRLSFPGSRNGRALVSIENGTDVLDAFWVDTRAGRNEVRIEATPEMSPNVYASVHMIQPHGQTDNDLPIRMFGVVPVLVDDPETILNPVIDMPDELRPESRASLRVHEEDGRPMTYTVAIVDEGLLDITNFRTPDPRRVFYAREALGVLTWDLYNDVTSAYAESLRRILAIGGDMEAEDSERDDVNRFPPMVRHLGPFHLKAGETATHEIDVPNYIGSVRTMVVAGHDKAYGNAETATPVRQPVMVLGTLPRVLSPGETVTLPVSVFAMREDIRNVDVTVEVSDIFEIDGPSIQEAVFERMGDQTLRFKLKVNEITGTGRVRITAQSGTERAYDEIQMEIRSPSPPAVQTYLAELQPGETWNHEFDPIGMDGTNTASLEISGFIPIDLTNRLRFLMRYPHGCLEQRTSAVFPQLYLHHFMELSDSRKNLIRSQIESYINQIERFQHPSFGLSYWPGHDGTNSWSTIYAWHFLLKAQVAGYYVPSELLQHLNQVQRRLASEWRTSGEERRHADLVQSYRLYVLAMAGNPSLGAMNRLRESGSLSLQARWRLAAAYQIAGIPEAAEELARGVSSTTEDYRELGYTFGSRLRDQAMILETLSLLGHTTRAASVMRDVADQLNKDQWLSTQETAYALLASAMYIKEANPSSEMNVTYNVSSLGTGSVQGEQPLSILNYDIPGTEMQSALVENRGDGTVFLRLVQEGIPLVDKTEAQSSDLHQQVEYRYADGRRADPESLRQGTDIFAVITVTNPGSRGDYTELALTHMVPSGWEIDNTRLDDIAFGREATSGTHQDIRDDRIMTYFNLRAGESKTFRVRLTATYEGGFYLPAIVTYAMYDNSIHARTPGTWVEVVR